MTLAFAAFFWLSEKTTVGVRWIFSEIVREAELYGGGVMVLFGARSLESGASLAALFSGLHVLGPAAVSYTHLTLPTKRIV